MTGECALNDTDTMGLGSRLIDRSVCAQRRDGDKTGDNIRDKMLDKISDKTVLYDAAKQRRWSDVLSSHITDTELPVPVKSLVTELFALPAQRRGLNNSTTGIIILRRPRELRSIEKVEVASQTRFPYSSLEEEVGIGRLGLPLIRARSVKPQCSVRVRLSLDHPAPWSRRSDTGIKSLRLAPLACGLLVYMPGRDHHCTTSQ